MKKVLIWSTIITIVLILFPEDILSGEKLTVSMPPSAVGAGERIIAIKVTITSAYLISLPRLPKGWNVCVRNDPMWQTTVDGGITSGVGAIQIDFFKDFLVIEKQEPERIPFTIKAELVTTKDFAKEKQVTLETKDLILGKLPEDLKE